MDLQVLTKPDYRTLVRITIIFLMILLGWFPFADSFWNNWNGVRLLHSMGNWTYSYLECSPTEEMLTYRSSFLSQNSLKSLVGGLLLLQEDNCALGASVLREITDAHPDNKVAWFWLGIINAQIGDLRIASQCIQSAGAQEKIVLLAEKAYLEHNMDDAKRWLSVAANIDDKGVYEAVYSVAIQYYQLGQREDAVNFLQPFADALPPNSVNQLRTLGMMERFRGNIERAVQYYELALALQPDDLDLLYRLRSIWLDVGQYEKALPIVLREAELAPETPQAQAEIHLAVAWVYRLLGDYSNARAWALQAREFNAKWWPIYKEMGMINCLSGEAKAARANFNTALVLSAGNLDVYKTQASCLYALGDTEAAIRMAEQLTEEYGNDIRLISLYLDLGQWYTETGKIDRAITLYKHGLDIWPHAHWLQSRLAQLEQ